MMLLLSSKILTKHILSSVYYRMFVFFMFYFLLIKVHMYSSDAFCMQENTKEHLEALNQIKTLTVERDALVQQYADLSTAAGTQQKAYDHIKSELEGTCNIRNFGKTMEDNVTLKQQNKELLRDNAEMHSSYAVSQHHLKTANKTIAYYAEKQTSEITEKNSSSLDETVSKKELTDIYY